MAGGGPPLDCPDAGGIGVGGAGMTAAAVELDDALAALTGGVPAALWTDATALLAAGAGLPDGEAALAAGFAFGALGFGLPAACFGDWLAADICRCSVY